MKNRQRMTRIGVLGDFSRRRPRINLPAALVMLLGLSFLGCQASDSKTSLGAEQSAQPSERSRAVCRDRDPVRRALFGDLHIHTSFSMDAYLFDTRTSPADAYRFARGEEIKIAPLDEEGRPAFRTQIDRPLDFAAVTDHAENFGSVALCTRPGSPVYDTESCRTYRGENGDLKSSMNFMETVKFVTRRMTMSDSDEVCGEDGRVCRDAVDDPWQETQLAAEKYYDRSEECGFTTFVAYEYSNSPELSKVHRNVIFKSEIALPRPIHSQDEPEPISMLRRLRDECIDGIEGCDVLAIPHNSNLSDGRMFRTEYPGATARNGEVRAARLRAAMEPVVEIMQIKGDSECRNGLAGVGGAVDELCDFEKMRAMTRNPPPDCNGEIGAGALLGKGCVDRNDFVRTALIAGLEEEARIGVNPFQVGFGASTDEHSGTTGNVGEWTYGKSGSREDMRLNTSAGGLIGVYAEENARGPIFDGIRRRETFGTSGPRIEPRFFAGWDLDEDLCSKTDGLARAYASGVPMGSVLDAAPAGVTASPEFLVSATRDLGSEAHPGGKLERIQIIKGWVGENGVYEQKVFDVAGSKRDDSEVDLETCEPSGVGHDELCRLWSDPDFDPSERAVYYSRVVEMPSCRWSALRCAEAAPGDRPAYCDDDLFPKVVRERAWTSPIWVSPAKS